MKSYAVVVEVPMAFDQTVAAARAALVEEGFAVISEIDLQQQLRDKLNLQIRRYRILGVWVPTWEMQAIAHEPEIGVLLPSHVCVWEKADGTCGVATADLKALAPAEQHPALAEAARAVNARLHAVLDWVQTTTMTSPARSTNTGEQPG
jgi:uncharacterized protein (DUF302 family)